MQESQPTQAKKIVDINEPQICKNKGCGQSFKEKDNHDAACSYHPGPPVFHDRMRGVWTHFAIVPQSNSSTFCWLKTYYILLCCSGNVATFMLRNLMNSWAYHRAPRDGTMRILCRDEKAYHFQRFLLFLQLKWFVFVEILCCIIHLVPSSIIVFTGNSSLCYELVTLTGFIMFVFNSIHNTYPAEVQCSIIQHHEIKFLISRGG